MSEQLQPQLVMLRPRLDDLPPLELPDGASLRTFVEGDELHWRRIIRASFGWEWTADDFARRMRGQPPFRPERVLFVCWHGEPVGTATVWRQDHWGDHSAVLHMVGVLPEATGRRLGRLVSLACLHRMRDEGFRQATLQTDDFRLPAVRTYLNLGFRPLLVHDNQRERWPSVLRQVGYHRLADGTDWSAVPIVARPE